MRCRSHDEGDEDEGEQEAGDGEEADDTPAAKVLPGRLEVAPGPGKDIRMGVEDHEGQDEPEQVEGVVAGPEVTGSE